MKWLIVFDLDGTLTESKRPLSAALDQQGRIGLSDRRNPTSASP